MTLIALHGFFGRPTDFEILNLNGIVALDIFRTTIGPMEKWAKRFNGGVSPGSVLLGYSMGGRLALHCLLENPKVYRAAIIIAAHPGINNLCERKQRLFQDLLFAEKIKTECFDSLMAAWNDTAVLKTSSPPIRNDKDFSRSTLAQSLNQFSLGRQQFLPPFINELSLPMLWLYPKQERQKIQQIKLKHPSSQMIEISDGGHRFMFKYPALCRKHILDFLLSLSNLNGKRNKI
jgi:2-succinyl-6-hydroxy-2,4-cyclohexadiene-1-carboxylate synthase